MEDSNRLLGLGSGIAVFNPIPAEYAIPQKEIEIAIEDAIRECNNLGIVGKDVTPFLLQRVADITKGRSLTANVGLIENNARIGAEIAVALASLNNTSSFRPPNINPQPKQSKTSSKVQTDLSTDIMVIGSMAVDLTCTFSPQAKDKLMPPAQLYTSHPSRIHTSPGGVAHNIALAASYASSRFVRLVTAVGSDPDGAFLRNYVQNVGLDVKLIPGEAETARYVAIHTDKGNLYCAAADMGIIENLRGDDIRTEIRHGKPKFLAFDGNISPATVQDILEECDSNVKGISSQRDMFT